LNSIKIKGFIWPIKERDRLAGCLFSKAGSLILDFTTHAFSAPHIYHLFLGYKAGKVTSPEGGRAEQLLKMDSYTGI
jgi:hypothetical protein